MKNKGNRYSSKLKAEVALRACREDRTLAELSSEYGVSAMQIGRWKKTLLERAGELFESKSPLDIEKVTDPLYKEIGRLKMDVEWLKKNGEELNAAERRSFIDPSDPEFSLRRQCSLLGLSRSGYYQSLLPSLESDAKNRSAVHPNAILREPEDDALPSGSGLQGEPEAHRASDEEDGTGRSVSGAVDQQTSTGSQGLSLPASRI